MSPSGVQAADGFVIGDSIGQGIAEMVRLPSIARPSISLRRSDIAAQMRRAPKGAVIIMSLGLNDAADPLKAVAPAIERVITAAAAIEAPIVWIGPPCILRPYDDKVAALDTHLRQRLAGTPIQYVSLRDDVMCTATARTRDGVHFKPSGYVYVWQKVQRESALAATVENFKLPARFQPAKLSGKAE